MRWITLPKSFYVYELAVDRVVRYVGKGCNGRVFNSNKLFRNRCTEYRIVKDDLSWREAFQLERERVAMYPPGQLWNTSREQHSRNSKRASRVRWTKPGARERHSQAVRDYWANPTHRKIHSAKIKAARARSERYREALPKLSAATKNSWRSKEYRRKWLATRKARGPTRSRNIPRVAIV